MWHFSFWSCSSYEPISRRIWKLYCAKFFLNQVVSPFFFFFQKGTLSPKAWQVFWNRLFSYISINHHNSLQWVSVTSPYCHTVCSCVFNNGLKKFPSTIATAHTLPYTPKQITKKYFQSFVIWGQPFWKILHLSQHFRRRPVSQD